MGKKDSFVLGMTLIAGGIAACCTGIGAPLGIIAILAGGCILAKSGSE